MGKQHILGQVLKDFGTVILLPKLASSAALLTETSHLELQVGNAVTDARHIVIGMGSQQVLNAAFYALSNASRNPDGKCCPQFLLQILFEACASAPIHFGHNQSWR